MDKYERQCKERRLRKVEKLRKMACAVAELMLDEELMSDAPIFGDRDAFSVGLAQLAKSKLTEALEQLNNERRELRKALRRRGARR